MNIAIVGLGNIGSYLYNFIIKNKNQITKKNNAIPNVLYVSAKNIKKKRNFKINKKMWVSNYLNIPKDKNVDIVIELIGGAEGAAKKLVFASLKNGKHVVTANKALIAKYGDKLSKIAESNQVNLEYEAAVCGGVPIIRSIKEGLIANKVNKIYGIFNGTSNFILSSMDKDSISFNEALSLAKKLGYAESNPLSDINGEDVADIHVKSSKRFNAIKPKPTINSKVIDEWPLIFLMASKSSGISFFKGIEELAYKESNRLKVCANFLKQIGIKVIEKKDSLKIYGNPNLKLNKNIIVKNFMKDHRIFMMSCIAALTLVEGKSFRINDKESINSSFPSFLNLIKKIGAKIN